MTQTLPLDPKWLGLIDPKWIQELDDTPFLTRCRRRTVSRWELEAFAAQQYHYARHFTRYLCALMMNLVREGDRAALAENLFEEVGLGEGGGEPHSLIYRRMLTEMGIDPEVTPPLPATRALVDAMLSACADPDPMIGLGALCLGAEAIVPHVYSQIMRGFLSVGEAPETLRFFQIHIEDDDAHAVTMRKIIDRETQNDAHKLGRLRSSAERIIQARAAFFRGLSRVSPKAEPFIGQSLVADGGGP